MNDREEQWEKMRDGRGFVAALDQSGGSTPKALRLYGVAESSWHDESEMMDQVHAMRTRIITSKVFGGERILAVILFADTLRRNIAEQPAASYLWQRKRIVPILKVDQGLAAEADGVQLMKPMPGLEDLLGEANEQGVFGTKMRSLIKQADAAGIAAIVSQQFEVARRILAAGLVPIIEPEVDIHCPAKARAEALLLAALVEALDALAPDHSVMLKLTPPDQDDLYAPCVSHPKVLRVLALSGGYSREEANVRLSRQHGVVASFSRALTEGLSAEQNDADFDATLDASIESIYQASLT